MKVVLLSGSNCIHTIRWANGLVQRGVEVHLISLHQRKELLDPAVVEHQLPLSPPWGYVLAVPFLTKILRTIQPDILNVHYASGYGLLGCLCGFKPLLLSVWGSDVYDFPENGFLKKRLLTKNLQAATAIASTSMAMARQVRKYHEPEKIVITPFGVDENLFRPQEKEECAGEIVIGTVKTLKSKYGIDTLIRAFRLTVDKCREVAPSISEHLKLRIVGGGEQLSELQGLAEELNIADRVQFIGPVPHEEVADQLALLDIYVALSRSESFGVAILEASSCELPVVVSDADGPAEVTVEGVTGFVVPRENPQAAAERLTQLVLDVDLRKSLGKAGRENVLQKYTWGKSLDMMIEAYEDIISAHSAAMNIK